MRPHFGFANLDGAAGPNGLDRDEARDLLSRAIVGILSDLDPGDPSGREYRRKLAAALG